MIVALVFLPVSFLGGLAPFSHHKALPTYESRETFPASLEEAVGVKSDSLYGNVIEQAFFPMAVQATKRHITAGASANNSKVSPGRTIQEMHLRCRLQSG